ncbi:hypothetical protein F0243_27115 [Vibrio mediterranei]|nr:hypothetical protein [Vibrio mediterranei]NOI26764.1 hypothetical protein [Vibrio mediterranei]
MAMILPCFSVVMTTTSGGRGIRRFLPKGTDFDDVSDEELAKIEHILNTRGRESLGFYSPYDIFMQHLNAA